MLRVIVACGINMSHSCVGKLGSNDVIPEQRQ